MWHSLVSLIFPPRPTEVLINNAPNDGLMSILAPSSFHFDQTEGTVLLLYRTPLVHASILEAKFHANKRAQTLLGIALADYLKELSPSSVVLVPVPLSSKRRRSRGYNQVEEVCKVAEKQLNGSVTLMATALTRTRNTPPQTELNGESRRKNMVDAFSVSTGLNPDHTYICVDDVMTTGATLEACVSALCSAGLPHVRAIALAH